MALSRSRTEGIDPACACAALDLGFPPPIWVRELRSVAAAFPSSTDRCGIYLLLLSGGRYYIGQARDAVRRFSQHLLFYDEVQGFAFLPTPVSELDRREKELIFRAETAGLTLMNVVHVSEAVANSDLAALISPLVVERWLKDAVGQNIDDFRKEAIALSVTQIARQQTKFERMKRHSLMVHAAYQLYQYLTTSVPFPRTTEHSFWSVSCLPSTNKSSWPRLLCVSASVMEVFVVGEYKDPKSADTCWSFVNVASDVLFSSFGDDEGFAKAHPHVEVRRERGYRDAGQHQVQLFAFIQNDMIALLSDSRVSRAAGTLCLRLMKKRSSIYSKSHCGQLVNVALGMHDLPDKELEQIRKNILLPEDEPTAESAGYEVGDGSSETILSRTT